MDNFLVKLDKFKILNIDNPLGYIKDINSCFGLLIHKENATVIYHLAAFENGNIPSIETFKGVLDSNTEIVEIFIGPNTNKENLSTLVNILLDKDISYVIKNIFTNKSNQTSLGFDYTSKNYYSVEMNMGNPEFVLEYSLKQMSK
jgi:hypothetical protein